MLQVSKYSIARATKFSDAFVNIDPIMEQNIIFDGYYRSPLGEQFIEVSTSFRMMSMDMLRLYHMLSKVYYYRNATQQQAKLVLLTVQLPESYSPATPPILPARRLPAVWPPCKKPLLRRSGTSCWRSSPWRSPMTTSAASARR